MFTGIVNGIATIVFIEKKIKMDTLTVKLWSNFSKTLQLGDSISHNGCCLTIKHIHQNNIICDVIEETLKKTNLGMLKIGDKINVERALKYGDEIGGHIISGHVISTVEVSDVQKYDNNHVIWLKVNDTKLMKYLFYKGFICIDGISLTIGDIVNNQFCVNIIPQTLLSTTIKSKKNGSILNMEIDLYTQTIVDTTERFLKKNMIN
ncbi:riboflavin synthase subunit alpha [Buchnera aphidicola (Hyadaphis tataricae)]|uniref:Riboflavin synthase n=1 Tax=Buchnera aphidicola (Hyadaphis tataricae) TaxID=1241859 RepID=A0A4D6Y653_9GAMM|nr:riboflavin synthase subunit alpha [Buchnera aphidicola]QCI21430.1 riboflavin synthase subunit alpha [Buchnera aphidicola (Hyadaphis tataricae)]